MQRYISHACNLIDLGTVTYLQSYHLQKKIVDEIKLGLTTDTLILCEHLPVITLGRTGKKANLLVSAQVLQEEGVEFYQVDRGGDVTSHEPGQLVAYPILDLKKRQEQDIRLFLERLQKIIIATLQDFGIYSEAIEGKTGVWVASKKIASIGIGISHWITYHGLAININNNLKIFSYIRPCGMKIEMTSLSRELNSEINLVEFKNRFIDNFNMVFQ